MYAIKALLHMAAVYPETLVTVKSICEDLDMPEKYLEQVFNILKKSGILSVKRGAKGGYAFGRSLKNISAGDILRVIEGKLILVDCLLGEPNKLTCARMESCITRTFWESLSYALNDCVNNISLEDLKNRYLVQIKSHISH